MSDNFLQFVVHAVRRTIGDNLFSDQHAEQVTQQIIGQYGGDAVYISKFDPERRAKVLAEFNGCNRRELCAKHGISKTQFYFYLKGD